MENTEKKVEKLSVEEMTKFFNFEQAKQELESFAKEKGIDCQFFNNGCADVGNDERPLWYVGTEIKVGERTKWLTFQFNLFPMVIGCFGHHLAVMKIILERMSRADVPFYDNCRNIVFDSLTSSLTMEFCQSESGVASCTKLKIEFMWNENGLNLFLSAHRLRYGGGFNEGDDIASVIYSHDGKLTLLDRVYVPSLEDIENSYNCWQRGCFIPEKVKNPNLNPKVRALFQPNSTHDRLEPQHAPSVLSIMCKFIWRAGLTTNFAVTAALAEVLQMDGVEILDSFHFPNFNDYYLCKWPEMTPPIVMAVSFSVNDRKFVYYRNTNTEEFHIDEVGTGNKLVMMESFTNTNVGRIRSAICRFLGIQL